MLEVADRVERRVAIQSAVADVVALDAEPSEEVVQELRGIVVLVNFEMLLLAIGKATEAYAVLDADAGDGMERDEGSRPRDSRCSP